MQGARLGGYPAVAADEVLGQAPDGEADLEPQTLESEPPEWRAAGEGFVMRIRLIIVTGAALVTMGATGAAYAAVGQGTHPATRTAGVVSVSSPGAGHTGLEPGDDRGRRAEPGDDRGAGASTSSPVVTDDHGHGRGSDDGSGHH